LKILQIVPTLTYGDAVSNDTLALRDVLVSMGYETGIYAEYVDERNAKHHFVFKASELPKLSRNDVLIYHLSIASPLHAKLSEMDCRKIAIYHNVTPAVFFRDYSSRYYNLCKLGIYEIKQLNDVFDHCLAVSDFNRKDLVSYGYKCPIDVRPILIPFEDYDKTPSQGVIDKYNDGKSNILFVGRVAPNKKHEDVIAAFSCYKKHYNPDARLFLVGSYDGMEPYKHRLDEYVEVLGVEDVIFTGKIPFDEILAYYKIADIFLCMSEHEGFCVPLVEAMHFNVPIVAFASAAIPYTLAGSGVLLHDKDPLLISGMINRIMTDERLKDDIIKGQRQRVSDFSYEKTSALFMKYLTEFLTGGKSYQ